MSYSSEFSKYQTLTDILKQKKVKDFFCDLKPKAFQPLDYQNIDQFQNINLENYQSNIHFVFSFDGSKMKLPIYSNLQNANMHLIRVSQKLIMLDKLLEYQQSSIPNPKEYQDIFLTDNFNFFINDAQISNEEYQNPKDLFRFLIYQNLSENYNFFIDTLENVESKNLSKITFLDSLIKILEKKIEFNEQIETTHPCAQCSEHQTLKLSDFYSLENKSFQHHIQCKCSENPKTLFISDLLKFHECFSYYSNNDGLAMQFMNFLEKITFINLIHNLSVYFSENQLKDFFAESIFLLDGPLALFNYASWFSQSLLYEIQGLYAKNYEPLIIGVEKSGNFHNHLIELETFKKEQNQPLRKGFIFFLEDEYIQNYIQLSENENIENEKNYQYGKNKYFGKKFYYKNQENHLFVINLNFLPEFTEEKYMNNKNSQDYIEEHKRLKDLIFILENFSSKQYENALSFISMVHESASISNQYFSQKAIKEFIGNQL
jgi:hypothetical protein